MGSAKRQIEAHWEEPVNNTRNEAELRERAKSPDLMDRVQNVLSRIQRARDDQVETLLECDCDDIIRDLLALLEAKDKVIEKLPVTADGVRVVHGDRVWHTDYDTEIGMRVNGDTQWVHTDHPNAWCMGNPPIVIQECYSTREASLAAREQAEGGG